MKNMFLQNWRRGLGSLACFWMLIASSECLAESMTRHVTVLTADKLNEGVSQTRHYTLNVDRQEAGAVVSLISGFGEHTQVYLNQDQEIVAIESMRRFNGQNRRFRVTGKYLALELKYGTVPVGDILNLTGLTRDATVNVHADAVYVERVR